jgi:hypothetical protein
MIVAAIVGIVLYVANRASRNDEPDPEPRTPNMNTNREERTWKGEPLDQ